MKTVFYYGCGAWGNDFLLITAGNISATVWPDSCYNECENHKTLTGDQCSWIYTQNVIIVHEWRKWCFLFSVIFCHFANLCYTITWLTNMWIFMMASSYYNKVCIHLVTSDIMRASHQALILHCILQGYSPQNNYCDAKWKGSHATLGTCVQETHSALFSVCISECMLTLRSFWSLHLLWALRLLRLFEVSWG